jgi:hypothetical protein
MKLRELTEELKIEEAFAFYNGGKGLDHWSYSSTSSPFSKNIINYSFPQEVRRNFLFRYKPSFGNLVNNTVQRLIGDVIYGHLEQLNKLFLQKNGIEIIN